MMDIRQVATQAGCRVTVRPCDHAPNVYLECEITLSFQMPEDDGRYAQTYLTKAEALRLADELQAIAKGTTNV